MASNKDLIQWDTQRDDKGQDGEDDQNPTPTAPPAVDIADGKEKDPSLPFMGPRAFDANKI